MLTLPQFHLAHHSDLLINSIFLLIVHFTLDSHDDVDLFNPTEPAGVLSDLNSVHTSARPLTCTWTLPLSLPPPTARTLGSQDYKNLQEIKGGGNSHWASPDLNSIKALQADQKGG